MYSQPNFLTHGASCFVRAPLIYNNLSDEPISDLLPVRILSSLLIILCDPQAMKQNKNSNHLIHIPPSSPYPGLNSGMQSCYAKDMGPDLSQINVAVTWLPQKHSSDKCKTSLTN